MEDKVNFLIWWTNQEQCESVDDMLLESLPEYVQSQYHCRYGRNARGRLWVHPDIESEHTIAVDPWPDTSLARELEESGGIVFKSEDIRIETLALLPGIVTNLDLVDIRESGPGEEDGPWAEGWEERANLDSDENESYIDFEATQRGFERGEFTDLYGHQCSIQDSSLATEAAIWLGIIDAKPQRCIPGQGWTDVEFPEDTLFHTRMHLNQEQAKQLVEALQRFIETGTISEQD